MCEKVGRRRTSMIPVDCRFALQVKLQKPEMVQGGFVVQVDCVPGRRYHLVAGCACCLVALWLAVSGGARATLDALAVMTLTAVQALDRRAGHV